MYTLLLIFTLVSSGDGFVHSEKVTNFSSKEACEKIGKNRMNVKLSENKRNYIGYACREEK